MKRIVSLLVALCLALAVVVGPVRAATYFFNPHYIISDAEFIDYQSLNQTQIELFLQEQGSGLVGTLLPDADDNLQPASAIIWRAAFSYQINPKVLLTTLQKEQSLINDPNPTVNQINKAMGYRCPDDGGCNPSTLTFGKQVDGAAWQFRQYLDQPERWNFRQGGNYQVDGVFITPTTQATAGLYNYTPHYSGNERFWRIWLTYWAKNYPDGSLVKVSDNPGVWLIQYGARRLITSYGVLVSRFDPKKILSINQTDLEKYEIGPSLQFHNHSLLRLPDGTIYFLRDDNLRHIVSLDVFRSIGFNPEEIVQVEPDDLAGYQIGEPITIESVYPTGALIQNKTSGGVYFVQDGIKHPIYDRAIMTATYPNRVLTSVNPEELEQYQTGAPVKFRDGELIKAKDDPAVYVIADGQRHWIGDEETFAQYGYAWDNVIMTTSAAVELHPLGEDIKN